MTVRQLLDEASSRELTEWKAYEKAFGPLGSSYSDEMLAQIYEMIWTHTYLSGAQAKKNPIPTPKRSPRPVDAFKEKEDDSIVNQAEFNTML